MGEGLDQKKKKKMVKFESVAKRIQKWFLMIEMAFLQKLGVQQIF